MTKLTILIMTVFLLQVSAASNAQITLKENKASLRKVLKSISKQSGYDFIYSIQDLDKAVPVSVNLDNASISRALELCFDGQPLIYELSEKTVMVRAKEDKGVFARIMDRLNAFEASGKVVDAEGKPLPGATIRVKNGKGSTLADANGRFTLGKVEEGTVLVISYTGYVSKEVVASANMGNVVLELSLSKLDEVQVIAYGTTTQRLSTGNVTTIKADVIEKQPVNNPLLALQGRVPGLFIEQATGFAGTGVKVRIQGTNSIANGNDPLYVIDGVPFTSQLLAGGNDILKGNTAVGSVGIGLTGSPLNFINPANIESISVLKDADATAIYGSRAANGAILITTKKGKSGDVKVDANIQNGWGSVARKLKLMDSEQYLAMRNEAYKNDGIDLNQPPYNSDQYKINRAPDLSGIWNTSRFTDWQEELIGDNAQYTDIQTSISGGNNQTVYMIGGSYHKEGNVFPGNFSDVKKSIGFSLTSSSLNEKFKIQFSGSYLDDYNMLPKVDLTSSAMTLAPIAPSLYDLNGNINWQPVSGVSTFTSNPIGYLYQKFNNSTTNLIANTILSYQLLKGLEIKSSLGYTKMQSNTISTNPPTYPEFVSTGNRETTFGNSLIDSWTVEPQIRYKRSISKGQLEVLVGTTIQKEQRDASTIKASGFSTDQVMEDIKSAKVLTAELSSNSVYKYNALFGRVNYDWEGKYIFNLTGRRDGSSRFGSENQFHNFGAIGAAWIFSEESFIKNSLSLISFGKLRASYGLTGSDQISDYRFLSLYEAIPYITSLYQGAIGYQPIGLQNPYLQWEETNKLQFGVDLGLINDKILVNANYYRNRSSNQLLNYVLAGTTGFGSVESNLPATVQNSGLEITLATTVNAPSSSFKWSTSLNLTLPKNKLLAFKDLENTGYKNTYVVGETINRKLLFHYSGVDPTTGVYQFIDRNGELTFSPSSGADDYIVLNTDPKLYGGFQNSFSYKGFQLDILFQFTKQKGQNYIFGNGFAGQNNKNQPASLIDRWQEPGDFAQKQKYTSGSGLFNSISNASDSDAGWSDASYIRLKNTSLSWQLSPKITKMIGIQNGRLYMQAQNLLTITSFPGLDPESKSSLSLPPLRVITMGIQIGI